MDNLLEINNLNYSYKNKSIFTNLQISIKPNTTNLILGANSSGKTTLLRLVSGILPTNNFINLDGISLNKKTYREYLLSIGVVFYDDNNKFLFEKVADELTFPLENLNYNKEQIVNMANEIVKLLSLQNCMYKNINELTTFEQVKVLLGVSIIHKPKIILLDNILSKLNENELKKIFKILNKIKKEVTICITSTDMNSILNFDNVIVISDGKTLIEGKPKDVLAHDNELAKAGLVIPTMIDLSLKLSFYNLVDEIITDVDGMVDKLWK